MVGEIAAGGWKLLVSEPWVWMSNRPVREAGRGEMAAELPDTMAQFLRTFFGVRGSRHFPRWKLTHTFKPSGLTIIKVACKHMVR